MGVTISFWAIPALLLVGLHAAAEFERPWIGVAFAMVALALGMLRSGLSPGF